MTWALSDEEIRADLDRANLFNAACIAARASAMAAADATGLTRQALSWLREDVERVQRRVSEIRAEVRKDASTPARRQHLEAMGKALGQHLSAAHWGDPDLQPLRNTTAFREIFPEPAEPWK
jgi:hypothetical protein